MKLELKLRKENRSEEMSTQEAGLIILHAFSWYLKRKKHLIQTFKKKLEVCQVNLCRLFRGYLFRKAFLANSIVFMDVYLPISLDVQQEDIVFVVGDYTDDIWKDQTKCEYSDYFSAFKAIIPVIDGSQFKFIVNGEYMVSDWHPMIRDSYSGDYNNVVEIYHYVHETETYKNNRKSLINSLSLTSKISKYEFLDSAN